MSLEPMKDGLLATGANLKKEKTPFSVALLKLYTSAKEGCDTEAKVKEGAKIK